jgi:hypothetical protein
MISYIKSKKVGVTEVESRMVVTQDWGECKEGGKDEKGCKLAVWQEQDILLCYCTVGWIIGNSTVHILKSWTKEFWMFYHKKRNKCLKR